MSIQIKRGMKKDLPQLKDGELAFCRDTKELYVGNNGNENVSVTKKVEDRLDTVDSQLEHIENNIIAITTSMSISDINAKLSNGGTFLFKGGTFLLDKGESITVTSNSRLIFEPNAIIKYNYNQSTNYTILDINGCENVIIEDAYLIGCRDTHVGTDGEWGYGIGITASRNIKIIRPRIEKTWGDGIYIGYKWNEVSPAFRTSNIEVLNSHILNCSRNGISICSVDNLLIDTAWIEGINRVNPMAAIDIEPECGTEVLIHMSNITINNLTTKNNPVGIGTIMATNEQGCKGCKITVNNHINYGGTAVSMWGDVGYEYEFIVNGGMYYDTQNVAINVVNTGLASKKVFSDIKIIGKTKDSSGGDYSTHSAVKLSCNRNGNFGNVLFRNVLIDTNGYNYVFSNPFSVVGTSSDGVTTQIQNITIENFRTTGTQGAMYLPNVDLNTFKANNLYIPVTSNYYLRDLNRTYYTDFTYTNLGDWSTVNITELLPDGVYTIRVLKSNGRYVMIHPKGGLSFTNGATSYTLKEGEFEFIKMGANITALRTGYNGGFNGL